MDHVTAARKAAATMRRSGHVLIRNQAGKIVGTTGCGRLRGRANETFHIHGKMDLDQFRKSQADQHSADY